MLFGHFHTSEGKWIMSWIISWRYLFTVEFLQIHVGTYTIKEPNRVEKSAGGPNSLNAAMELIKVALNPVILAGGGVVMANAVEDVKDLAEFLSAPVCTTYLHNDSFPASHPLWCGPLGYLGHQTAMNTIKEADLVIAVGSRYEKWIWYIYFRNVRLLTFENYADHFTPDTYAPNTDTVTSKLQSTSDKLFTWFENTNTNHFLGAPLSNPGQEKHCLVFWLTLNFALMNIFHCYVSR